MAKKTKTKPAPTYEELRREWYNKLKETGFEDIETETGILKEFSSTLLANTKKVLTQHGGWQAKEDYYRMAEHFLLDYKFKAKMDKVMWEYHANGISVRDIAKVLNRTGVFKTNFWAVHKVIERLRRAMFDLYGVK